MNKLPRRTREHVLEDESRQYVERVLPSEWIIESGKKDYGVDLAVEIVKESYPTGAVFLMQLKATDKLTITRDGRVSHSCKTSTLAYFLQRPELIVYLVYDAQEKAGYWIWIQDYIRQGLKPGWEKQKTVTIHIPKDNIFDDQAVAAITRRSLHFHERKVWSAAVETVQNPHFKYTLHTTDDDIRVTVSPRYTGALDDRPVEFKGILKFDLRDPEAEASFQAFKRHVETGEPVEIDSRFFEGFDIPETFSDLLAHVAPLRITRIQIGTATTEKKSVFRLTVLDPHRNILAELPFIELSVVQAGTEQVVLSNTGQNVPFEFVIRINSREQTTSISIQMDFEGLNVLNVQALLRLQQALAYGTWMKLTDLSTGLSDTTRIPAGGMVPPPDEASIAIANYLLSIQEAINTPFYWPHQITASEAQIIEKVAVILQTGVWREPAAAFHFQADKTLAQKLAAALEDGQHMFRFDIPDQTVDVLGVAVPLGPAQVVLPTPQLGEEFLRRVPEPDRLPEDVAVPVDVATGEAGAFFVYHRWVPQNPKQL